jgi:hypothetical protein
MTTTKPLNSGLFHPSLVNPYQRHGFFKNISSFIFKFICTRVNSNHHNEDLQKLCNQFTKEEGEGKGTDKEVA